jgi:hypothetical protein
MNDSLSCLTYGDTSDWNHFLPGVQFAYNTTPHAAIRISPHEVLFGIRPPPLVDYEQETVPLDLPVSLSSYVTRLKSVILQTRDAVSVNVRKAWLSRAVLYNAGRKKCPISIGDYVLARLTPKQSASQISGKLRIRWSEPLLVTSVKSSGQAFDCASEDGKTFVINASRLLPLPPSTWVHKRIVDCRVADEVVQFASELPSEAPPISKPSLLADDYPQSFLITTKGYSAQGHTGITTFQRRNFPQVPQHTVGMCHLLRP